MTDIQKIESTLKRGQLKLFASNCWATAWKALVAGSGAVIIWIVLYKLCPIPEDYYLPGIYISASVIFLIILIKYLRYPSKGKTAVFIDQSQKLQERISTVLEWKDSQLQSPWTNLMLKDTLSKIDSIDWNHLIKFQFPKSALWSVILILAILGLGFVPEYRTKSFVEKQKFNEISKETGKELAKILNSKLEQRPESAEELSKELIQEGLALADQLGNTKLTKATALRKLEKLSDQFKEQAQKLNLDPSQKRLMEAANQASNATQPNSAGDKFEEMESLNQKVGDLKPSKSELGEALDKLEELKDLADALKSDLKDPNSSEAQAIEDAAKDLAQALEDMGFDPQKLNNAINALKAGDAEEFLENLEFTTQDLQDLLDMANALEELEQEIGKNLQEQLEKGQIPAAQKTLQQMQDQIEQGDLTDEQRAQMVQDLMDAAEQMQDFPEMQQNLMQAANNLANQNDEQAQQNLAEAAQNLQEIMEQLQNAQDMQDILASLKNAGAALAAGKRWQRLPNDQGQGQGQGQGMENRNMGGGGFGTWSDGQDPLPQQKSNLVDQSGMSQQTLEQKGVTEREQAFNQSNFTQDQVKGDLSPGSSMPSIPLHGLHIKGRSKVSYQEVISEINSSQAGSIDQTKIPRYYQKSVKNYFDE